MTSPDTGSTASKGSSKINSRGAWINAQASPIFFVIPAEYSTTSVAIVGQGKCIEQLGRAGGDLGRRHHAQQADIAQQLRTTQPIEEPQSVRQDAHQGLRCSWVSPDVMIKNACCAGIRAQ